uniref:Uncharacterized protein n=1 Tax=Arundo donax TaxID=35708 RepID=A0A0A8YZQ8_ARUDO
MWPLLLSFLFILLLAVARN